MKIAELVVDIVLKGGNKVVDGLSSTKNWLTDISAAGIATKAAILGAVYALEKMTSASGKFGNDVKNLSTLTGIDEIKIQQWAEAIRKGGASAEDAHAALLAASKTQAEIAKGNYPAGLGRILSVTQTNLQDVINNPLKFADMVRKYILTSKEDISLINNAAESVGFSPGAITATRRNPENIYGIKKNISSKEEIEDLAKVYQAWSDFNRKFEKIRDMFTAKLSFPLIGLLESALVVAEKLATQLSKIVDFFKWWSAYKDEGTIFKDLKENVSGLSAKGLGTKVLDFGKSTWENRAGHGVNAWHPPMRLQPVGKSVKTSQNNTINVYQTGIEDTHESVPEFKNEISRAFYSINTIGQIA